MSNQNLGRLQILPLNQKAVTELFGEPDIAIQNKHRTTNWIYHGDLYVLGDQFAQARVCNLRNNLYQTMAFYSWENNNTTNPDGDWFLLDADCHAALATMTHKYIEQKSL